MRNIATGGFTLAEMLVAIGILAILAAVVIPRLSSNDPQKLNVAAEETANTLRFALSEARRSGGYVLVDGLTDSGRLRLYYADSEGRTGNAINDPLTKRAANLDVGNSAFARGVTLSPQFMGGGVTRKQLLIGASGQNLTLESMNGIGTKSALQPGSSVLLSLGAQSTSIGINEVTGLVILP